MNAFQNGAPAGAPDAYATPKPDLPGPVLPTWESLRETYTVPTWFNQAKFGIFIQCWFYIQHSCETMARHRIRSH
jgi:alpha-L-fucosidase